MAVVPVGAVRVVVSFLVATAVLTATLHLAARYVLGEVPLERALLVGPVVPLVVLVAGSLPAPALVPLALVADLVAVRFAYDVGVGRAGLVAVVHFASSLLLALFAASVVRILAGAPA